MFRLPFALLALSLSAIILVGCQTTATSTKSVRDPLPITVETRELLLGYWDGEWEADNGSNNAFSLDITEIGADGTVHGKRAYVTERYGSSAQETIGEIRGGKLHLDTEKGPKSWIELALERDQASGELWLTGRYSAQGGDKVFLGDIAARKWKDL